VLSAVTKSAANSLHISCQRWAAVCRRSIQNNASMFQRRGESAPYSCPALNRSLCGDFHVHTLHQMWTLSSFVWRYWITGSWFSTVRR